MRVYNMIMQYFWLSAGIAIFGITTYMSFTDGIAKWGFYYVFVAIAFGMFFFKRWMTKRMEKHLEYLKEQHEKQANA
jgi:hypothetical protein